MMAKISSTNSGARPMEGSSSSSSFGAPISARPIASICCSPPDSDPANCASRSRSRGKRASTAACRRAISARPGTR